MDEAKATDTVAQQPGQEPAPDVKKLELDRKAALGQASEAEKKANRLAEELKHAHEEMDALRSQREQAELDAVRDDPDQLTVLQERKRQREHDRVLLEREKNIQEKEARADKKLREVEARSIATEYSVDFQALIDLDMPAEKMRAVVDLLPKVPQKTLNPDSALSTGGGASRKQVIKDMAERPWDPGVAKRYRELSK